MVSKENSEKKEVIMQILPALNLGGVERGTVDIAKELKKQGIEPIVMSNGGVLTYQLKEAKITHIKLAVHSKNPLRIFSNIKKIEDVIKKHQVTLVHVRSRAPMWSAYFACKRTKTKLVTTIHGFYSLQFLFWKRFTLKFFYNALMLKADAIIAVSEVVKKYIAQNYSKNEIPTWSSKLSLVNNYCLSKKDIQSKITVIHRGVDLNSFNIGKISKNRIIDLMTKWGLPEDKKIIMLPARLTSWKGHEFLLDALANVKNDFFCIFVGSEYGHRSYAKRLENKIIQMGLSNRVKLVGQCNEMGVAYALANIVVSASTRPEAFGRVAIEAQATSRIIVATEIGGSLETIIDGKTGFLVNYKNSAKMAETIDKLLLLPQEELLTIEKEARLHVEQNFSNEKMYLETIALYKKLLSKKS